MGAYFNALRALGLRLKMVADAPQVAGAAEAVESLRVADYPQAQAAGLPSHHLNAT
jgi:hypothetical protein